MVLKNIMGIVAITMVVATSDIAAIGVPDLNLSTATRADTGPGTAVLFNVPNGGGSPLNTAAWIFVGGTVDATITLFLVDGAGVSIANYPFEDMWLESVADCDPGCVYPCPGGTTADAHTDAQGMTTWVNPLRAGGWSEGPTRVMISGTPLSSGDLNIGHNSTDINGDGSVNLTDVGFFAGDYFGAYTFRSDFHHDGVLNLSDVAKLGPSIGASCP